MDKIALQIIYWYDLFFDIVDIIIQAFKPGYKLLYPSIIVVYCLLTKPYFNFDFDLIIAFGSFFLKDVSLGKWISVIARCKVQAIGLPTYSVLFLTLVLLLEKVWHHLVTVCRFIKFSPIERISLWISVRCSFFCRKNMSITFGDILNWCNHYKHALSVKQTFCTDKWIASREKC